MMADSSEPKTLQIGDSGISAFTPNPSAGDVRFFAGDGSETILLRHDGKIFIRGEEVADNRRVYEAFLQFLGATLGFRPSRPDSGIDGLSALEWAIANAARDNLPLDVVFDIQRRRAADVPPGTIRIVLETC